MNARIYLDLEALHPILEGQWHRARFTHVPEPGEQITLLCGRVATATFEPRACRTSRGVPTCCWECDLSYRRRFGFAVPSGHPAA